MTYAEQHFTSGELLLDNNETLVAYVAASTSNQKINDLEAKVKDLPDKYLMIIAQFLSGHINDSDAYERFNGPILKASIKSVYWIFLIQYAVLAMLGILMNVAIMAYIMYHKLYKDVTHAFIMNLALCHFVQCAIVLPITLMVMLVQNWIYGQFLCFFLPMLQDIPLHVAMISHILIAWDRMRWLGDPLKGRLPAFVCCCATWLTGMVIALPYPIYTIYVEIGDFVPRLNGIGLCVVNLMDDMHEYMRGLFVIMYCAPAILLAYLYIRTSQELRPPDGPFAVMMFEHRADIRNRQRNSSASSVDRSTNTNTTTGIGTSLSTNATATATITSTPRLNGGQASTISATRSFDLYNAELDVCREKRKQRNFGSMAAAQVVCLCPLMILRLARMVMEETYDNTKHFDFTFLMFVWIAFLPTVIFPCIYASQILPRTEQERLRGYLRLSSKRMKKSHSADDSGHSPDSRDGSIEKDENTNTTLAASIIPNDSSSGYFEANGKHSRQELLAQNSSCFKYQHSSNGVQHASKAKLLAANSRSSSAKKDAIAINIISESKAKLGATSARANHLKPGVNGLRVSLDSSHALHPQRKLTIESIDNNSCSNLTNSTYCNGTSSMLEADVSNFGDGEDSSIVSGMILQGNGGAGGSSSSGYQKWSGHPLRRKDSSFSDCDSFTRMDSSSTLARDMEIIDLLERERSMDIQEMIAREQRCEPLRLSGERRRLPDIEKIYKSPKPQLDPYSYEKSVHTRTASTASVKDALPVAQRNSSELSSDTGLHTSNNETYGDTSTLHDDDALTHNLLEDDEVPPDFFDKYTPGGVTVATTVPPITPTYQYQYSRRLSRKSSHHSQGSQSHRASKRDSFNSLNGGDLIAGAFGELDPTQPLSKMSVIESRMRRSSGRTSSFSSSGRSSLKSRDYNHGSTHSTHPELDFRENIFAEL